MARPAALAALLLHGVCAGIAPADLAINGTDAGQSNASNSTLQQPVTGDFVESNRSSASTLPLPEPGAPMEPNLPASVAIAAAAIAAIAVAIYLWRSHLQWPRRGWLYVCAALPTLDAWSDIALALVWMHAGRVSVGLVSLLIVANATLWDVVLAATDADYREPAYILSSVLQLRGPYLALRRQGALKRSDVEAPRATEALLEACPQTYVQLYMLLSTAAVRAPWLSLTSLACSLLSISSTLGERLVRMGPEVARAELLGEAAPTSTLDATASFSHVFGGMLSRALAVALCSRAFGDLLVPVVMMTVIGVTAVRIVTRRAREPGEPREGGCIALFAALFTSIVPVATEGERVTTVVFSALWLSVVEVGVTVFALAQPSEWRTAQSHAGLGILAALAAAGTVLKLASLPVLASSLQRKGVRML